jgi:hypothetical protein
MLRGELDLFRALEKGAYRDSISQVIGSVRNTFRARNIDEGLEARETRDVAFEAEVEVAGTTRGG